MVPIISTKPKISDFTGAISRKETSLVVLENSKGMSVGLTNYGARIVSLRVPDKNNLIADVVLGYNTLLEYLRSNEPYFGATIGRYANRIENGKFDLNGSLVQLDLNENSNHLHGGNSGFHNLIWDVRIQNEHRVVFRLLSENGDSGYPGALSVEVSFTLTEENELLINYSAITEESTIINLTNHAYFNLAGAGAEGVGEHLVTIFADSFTPLNKSHLPTGEIKAVSDTPFDFRKSKAIKADWDNEDAQIQLTGGFDHNFVLNKEEAGTLELAARIEHPESGRILEVKTTEPGLQFYTANKLTGRDIGREGVAYQARTAFCLETQHFPNSPNISGFPSVILDPGIEFKSTTVYRFL